MIVIDVGGQNLTMSYHFIELRVQRNKGLKKAKFKSLVRIVVDDNPAVRY